MLTLSQVARGAIIDCVKTAVFTGGHHTSSLAVAKLLKNKGWNVVWIGHRFSMWGDSSDSAEFKDVTAANIKFYNLWAGRFYNTYDPLKLILIPIGFIHALFLLFVIRPQGIVSFGGYLSVPVVIVGWILGIPAITHEQTVVVGWANRAISFFVEKIAVTWPSSLPLLPKSKVEFVGLPLRLEIVALKKINKPKKVYDPITVYITGGKQGSHALNEVVFLNLQRLLPKYRLIHQTGTSTLYSDLERANQINVPHYESFGFDPKKGVDALKRADVVVSRSGAHSVYELAILGKKCVLVPISWGSHSEQEKNAQVLVEANLGVVLPEEKLEGTGLINSIEKAKRLMGQPINLPLHASETMVQLIEQEFKV